MNKTLICLLFSASFALLQAQNKEDALLQTIEENNVTLRAMRASGEAEKLNNRTGLTPPNPEVSFEYLWGNPTEIGNQIDYSVSQSFDFPTAYVYRSRVAKMKNGQVDMAYEVQRRDVIFEARQLLVEWVRLQQAGQQADKRLEHAESLNAAYVKLLARGETTVLEMNKTQLNLALCRKNARMNAIESEALLTELARLNGGKALAAELLPADYPTYLLPASFDAWYSGLEQSNPELRALAKQVEESRTSEKLRLSENLPKFKVGYYSEHVLATRLQGVQAGISIPLWENANRLKQQKARTVALQAQHEDAKQKLSNGLSLSFNRAVELRRMLDQYEQVVSQDENIRLLDRALELGELSLINYMQELTIYYDIVDEYIAANQAYQAAVAELRRWE